ncbi:MAG: hypothetical protein CVU97_05835 [Firmicutes bacterium HGW-Firmicutes-21]|nr:MAG: hypothetical protein CVU97_05835 [Firmicutes bacterium HGW-Firmicutes-21]
MRTKDDIVGNVYKRFIDAAVDRSDMFYFDVYWYDMGRFASFVKNNRIDLFNSEVVHENEINLYEKTKIFIEKCMPFIKSLEPFLIKCEKGRQCDKNYYKCCKEVIPILLKPQNVLSWRYPYFPDNIAFCRNKYFWFITTTHEYGIDLFANDEKEKLYWEDLGIEFFDSFDIENDVIRRPKVTALL